METADVLERTTWVGGMAAQRRRSALTILLVLTLLAYLALAGHASAAPLLSIGEPASGSTTNSTPTFSGTTDDAVDHVKVLLYRGSSVGGSPDVTLESPQPAGGSWSVQASGAEALTAGVYTAVAEQTESFEGGLGESSSTQPVTFEVNTEPPEVTLNQPTKLSNDRTPSFSGSTSEAGEVVVHVFLGSEEVAKATATTGGGSWSSSGAGPALPAGRHTFTAYASEQSGIGNGEGRSAGEVSFEVNTNPPEVTLNQPVTPSNNQTPSFSGTASEAGKVVVHILQGGGQIATATATVSGGKWSSSAAIPALPEGKHSFTAYATEESALGNEPGSSGEVGFEVNTNPPEVTLNQPATPSNDQTPSFSGTASEAGKVVVHILEAGHEVAKATATASGGSWSSGAANPALAKGKRSFTAYATEQSALNNGEGRSAGEVSFEVNTEPPTLTINQPVKLSSNRAPSFSGGTSQAGEVIVHIMRGSEQVAEATATTSGGSWSSGAATPDLPKGKHSFTAYATEESALGNEAGRSGEVSFEVNTNPPEVTLNQPAKLSNNTAPSFSGSTSEGGEVVVHILEAGHEVAKATATTGGGSWSSSAAIPALPEGKHSFTAYATEESALGNEPGSSGEVGFEVNTNPPEVTLNQPATPSNDQTPSFSGTASEAGKVVVHVLEAGQEVAKATATTSGGSWSSGAASPALPEHKHSFTAYATETSGLGNTEGKSAPSVAFEVNTDPPEVTLNQPVTPSNNRTPSFSGTASEAGKVVVHILEAGQEVAKATATASGGSWSSGAATPQLPKGKHGFTAYATEKSGLGNPEGKSAPAVAFEVNTEPPGVSINQPIKLSNNRAPAFSGEASEAGEVVVQVFLGSEEVAKATATTSGGSWSSGAASPELPKGKHSFTVEATERSALGNESGHSAKLVFEVNTEPPEVTLKSPPLASNERTPAFSGTASEAGKVTVKLYAGTTASGTPVREVSGQAAGAGEWNAGRVTTLEDGKYTAVAGEPSSLGNPAGRSSEVSFEVNTNAPSVTLTQPRSPSRVTEPTFAGTVSAPKSEEKRVTVLVYAGSTPGGTLVATTEATVKAGSWTSGKVVLGEGNNVYTAVASTPSAIGNTTGESAPVTFRVDTLAPVVTLDQPKSPSNQTTPSFSGNTSESSPITVSVYKGSTPAGTPVATVRDKETTGAWEAGPIPAKEGLADGRYTAIATQPSSIAGNPPGSSQPVSFTVNTQTPIVTLAALPTPSPNRAPSFSGASSESEPVEVAIYRGSSPAGAAIAEVEGEVSNGAWITGRLEKPLEFGEYTAVATQASSIGNPSGSSAPFVFVVAQIPPTANTEAPSDVARSSAAFYASVNPHGGSVTDCHFEYGPTTSYGSQIECGFVAELSAFPAASIGAVAVFARVYGLHPSTTYHVRIVAVGEGGTGVGSDSTFTTLDPIVFPGTTTTTPVAVVSKAPTGGTAGFFAAQLIPRGRGARIGELLKKGFFKQRFRAAQAGTAVVKWFYQAPRAHSSAKLAPRTPVLVASGKAVFRAAGTATLKIRLTAAGRQLLKRSRRVRLKATFRFAPLSGTAVTASETFLLRR